MDIVFLILFFWIILASGMSAAGKPFPTPYGVVVGAVRFLYWLIFSPWSSPVLTSNQLLPKWQQWFIVRKPLGNVDTSNFNGILINGKQRLSIKNSHRHVLAIGATGAGKSSTLYLPNLLDPPPQTSFFVYDPKGELFEKSSGHLASIGYKVLCLNPTNLSQSVRFNPLKRALSISPKETRRLAEILVASSGSGVDKFWEEGARSLLYLLMRVLAHQPVEHQTLVTLRQLLNQMGTPDLLGKLIRMSGEATLAEEWEGLTAGVDPKTLAGWVANARTATDMLLDEDLAQLVADDTLDFAAFRTQPIALFLNIGERNLRTYAPLISLLLAQFIDHALHDPSIEHDPSIFSILFMLDEFGVFARSIQDLPEVLAVARSFKISFILAAQSVSQIQDSFGRDRARSILENCLSELYFSGIKDSETLRTLEERMGRAGPVNNEGFGSQKPLLSTTQIRSIDSRFGLFFFANKAGFLVRLYPYYRQRKLLKRSQLPPCSTHIDRPLRSIPRLDLHGLVSPSLEEEALQAFLQDTDIDAPEIINNLHQQKPQPL